MFFCCSSLMKSRELHRRPKGVISAKTTDKNSSNKPTNNLRPGGLKDRMQHLLKRF